MPTYWQLWYSPLLRNGWRLPSTIILLSTGDAFDDREVFVKYPRVECQLRFTHPYPHSPKMCGKAQCSALSLWGAALRDGCLCIICKNRRKGGRGGGRGSGGASTDFRIGKRAYIRAVPHLVAAPTGTQVCT